MFKGFWRTQKIFFIFYIYFFYTKRIYSVPNIQILLCKLQKKENCYKNASFNRSIETKVLPSEKNNVFHQCNFSICACVKRRQGDWV